MCVTFALELEGLRVGVGLLCFGISQRRGPLPPDTIQPLGASPLDCDVRRRVGFTQDWNNDDRSRRLPAHMSSNSPDAPCGN